MYPASAALGQGERLELRPSPSPRWGRGSPVPAPPQLPADHHPPSPGCPLPPAGGAPRPRPAARRESVVFAAKIKSKWKGEIRRFQAEQPDSSREGKKPSLRGVVKVNFKVMRLEMQRKFPFCARRGAELGEAGPGSRFARARWQGTCAGRERRGRRREAAAGCRMLLEPFAWRDAGSEQRASLAASALAPRCLEMDHLGEPASPRESGAVRRREGKTERKSF